MHHPSVPSEEWTVQREKKVVASDGTVILKVIDNVYRQFAFHRSNYILGDSQNRDGKDPGRSTPGANFLLK